MMIKNKKRDWILSLASAAVILAVLIFIDKRAHYSMLASVIQKAAIYSLLAVSLNLLNGFTGLFSPHWFRFPHPRPQSEKLIISLCFSKNRPIISLYFSIFATIICLYFLKNRPIIWLHF